MLDTNFPLYAVAFLATFFITVSVERILIPKLAMKAKQPIYEGGPKWHSAKSGTPTMGGLAFLLASSIALLLGSAFLFIDGRGESGLSLLICLGYSIANALIGIIDDRTKLKRKENAGLSPKQKLLAQSILSALFLLAQAVILKKGSTLAFSFGEIDLGAFYYILAMLILLGITNCANLTDGIDGLASSVGFSVGISLFYISCALSYDTAFISSAITGATAGFLVFNMHPARIFMGDTGSLFLGALAASGAFALGNPLLIVFIGFVYVIEGISVILQVIGFKLTGRRIFKMAPIHHHLEQKGWEENKICLLAMIITFIFSIPAFIFYLP